MNGKFHDQIPVKIDTTNSKRKKPKHNQNSPKIILHENPSPKISYPKIPLSELLKSSQTYINSKFSLKKLVIHCLKRFENINLKIEDRKKLWLLITQTSERIRENPTLYQDIGVILEKYPKYFSKNIELDVERTFKNVDDLKLKDKLREVLNSYACRNPYIGYCQGLNFIAGELLKLGFQNEETFWLFGYLLEVALPVDYYTSMLTLMADQKVFTELLQLYLSELDDKFKELGLETSIFSLQWFVCLFSCTVEQEILVVIWDILLLKGHTIFHKIGITLLLLIKNDLMKAQNFGFLLISNILRELLLIIEEKIKALDDVHVFQKTFFDLKIPKKMLNEIYSKHNLQIKTEFEQLKKATTISKDSIAQKKLGILTEEKCNPTSPVCLKTLEKKKNLKKKQSFLIYRQAFSPHILPNYIQDISQKIPFKEGKKKSAEDYELSNEETMKLMQKPENSVLIGRFHHICFKKHITSRQRKKEDFSTESFNMIIDEKSSKNDIEKSKMLRSSSLKKLKNSEINIKTNEKFSEKVNNSKKNSFLNFFKNSFCIAQQLNPFQKNIEPRILDFDSFLVKDKPTYQKNEYFNILQSKGSELLKQEQKVELENFYENGLGLLPLSSLDTDFFDKFKNEMERSKSISFNKHFLDDN